MARMPMRICSSKLATACSMRSLKTHAPMLTGSAQARKIYDRYLDDPLCGFNFKLGGTRDVVRILMEVSRKDWAQKVPQDLPIMLISGAKDSVGFNGRGVFGCVG
mgnify:CR=1 FL=1